jgi:hypothetical protein
MGFLYKIRVTPAYGYRQPTNNFSRSGAAPAPARTARDVNATSSALAALFR